MTDAATIENKSWTEKAATFGFVVKTREDVLANPQIEAFRGSPNTSPEQIIELHDQEDRALRARVEQYEGSHVVFSPDGGAEDFVLVGNDPEELARAAYQRECEIRAPVDTSKSTAAVDEKTNSSLEFGRIITVSTGHIPQAAREYLERRLDEDRSLPSEDLSDWAGRLHWMNGPYGYALHSSILRTFVEESDDVPEFLIDADKLCREHDLTWLVYDQDADEVEELTYYEG